MCDELLLEYHQSAKIDSRGDYIIELPDIPGVQLSQCEVYGMLKISSKYQAHHRKLITSQVMLIWI